MSNTPLLIQNLNTELQALQKDNDWEHIQRVVLSVIKLLDKEVDITNTSLFNLFTDSDGKIRANASWFFEDTTLADRKATYKINSENTINLDFKLYGLNKPSKRTISWAQALTPNFEDEPFNSKYNLGVDFIVPKSLDKVIVVLSDNYVVRTLELKGELTVTYQEIFDKWLKIQDFTNKKEVHNILWESFDLQPLNKKFYAGISERFLELRQHLINNNILDEKHSSMFSNRLIGRVIFCWFIDKKGILNPENKYFDSRSFESATKYYKERLEKLFFEILNTPIEERMYPDRLTPFLNGGLFEPRTNDLYQNEKLTFPANFFDSLFTFLSGYNFTTDESTSQFQQVAIDPEMLGRIFENLLAEINEDTGEQARKAKGAFYTPREIVDYMCKESLKEYLKTKLPEDEFRDQRLFQLIDAPDKDFQDQDHNWRRDWKPYKDQLIKALDELKVIDIACGSGAFPIGMMQLLLKVYERLEARFDPYKTKLQVIEQNIFGVDIEPMAVEIARLRAWLSIVVDEESDSKNIKPLPNLEFKFVCANSLVKLDTGKNETVSMFEDTNLDEKLQEIRHSYFKTENLNKKKALRDKFKLLVDKMPLKETLRSKQLKSYRPFDNENSTGFYDSEFIFGLNFFDVILGNPPYIRVHKQNKDLKKYYKDTYETAFQDYDLYSLFFERSLELATPEKGIIHLITPDKYLVREYGEPLRKMLLTKQYVSELFDLSRATDIFGASIYPMITKIIKTSSESINIKIAKSINKVGTKEVDFTLPYTDIKPEEPLNIVDPQFKALISKIEEKTSPLKELLKESDLFCGTPRAKDYYEWAKSISENATQDSIPLYVCANIKPYSILRGKKIRSVGQSYTDPYIKNDRSVISKKRWDDFKFAPKILIRGNDNRITATIDEIGSAFIGIYAIKITPTTLIDMHLLTAILNSKYLNWFFKIQNPSLQISGNYFSISSPQLLRLPIIKKIIFDQHPTETAKIKSLVKKLIDIEDISQKEADQNEIDSILLSLLGITESDIR